MALGSTRGPRWSAGAGRLQDALNARAFLAIGIRGLRASDGVNEIVGRLRSARPDHELGCCRGSGFAEGC